MPETRAEHLAWCKRRALELLETGYTREAITSMLSDLKKHPETESHIGGTIGVGLLMLPGWVDDAVEIRRWIEGFN